MTVFGVLGPTVFARIPRVGRKCGRNGWKQRSRFIRIGHQKGMVLGEALTGSGVLVWGPESARSCTVLDVEGLLEVTVVRKCRPDVGMLVYAEERENKPAGSSHGAPAPNSDRVICSVFIRPLLLHRPSMPFLRTPVAT